MLPNVAKVASLIGDPVRAKMLFALLDGRELSASELAFRGNASPQSASGHLGKLVDGGLVVARSAGRQRLFSLASEEIANAIEVLASIAPPTPVKSLNEHSAMQRMRAARSCYDHLAGRLGVGVTEALIEHEAIVRAGSRYDVTDRGERFFAKLGVDLDEVRGSRRHFARPCLDWTERRHHVAGALGSAILAAVLRESWVQRNARDRSLSITLLGEKAFRRMFGLRMADGNER